MKKITALILSIALTVSSISFAYTPTSEDTKALKQLTSIASAMYKKSPAKAAKFKISISKTKEQFKHIPRLAFIFGQLEVYISNLTDTQYKSTPRYKMSEIAQHNKRSDCRILIDETVYDISGFLAKYESFSSLRQRCGEDKTSFFERGSGEAKAIQTAIGKYIIGELR